jgi:hypothetical protein
MSERGIYHPLAEELWIQQGLFVEFFDETESALAKPAWSFL